MTPSSSNKVITFGCRLNTYESQIMQDLATNAGLQNTTIINTCAVTVEAERQAVQAIRRAHRQNPDSAIIVTGCAAQTHPDLFLNMPEVSRVIGNQEKMKVETYSTTDRHMVSDIMRVTELSPHLVSSFDGRTRAFIEIQNGCDHRCTYCIIPLGRGNSRSSPMGAIAQQVQQLVDGGIQEIVFTGVDITSYGQDLPGKPTLGQLVKRLLANTPTLARLRLSSLDPVEIDEDLLEALRTQPRLMPHIHLSLQAGDDLILKRMKRRHLRQDIIDQCRRIRSLRSDAVFGADIIVGFPTETDDMFQNTYDLISECQIPFLHIFSYSPRPGTPAARIPPVAPPIIKERSQRLHELGRRLKRGFFESRVGSVHTILIEKDYQGYTEQFCKVIPNGQRTPGTMETIRITGYTDTHLEGVFL